MKIGEQTRVAIIEQIDETRAKVQDLENNRIGILHIKGQLKVSKDGDIKAWLIGTKKQYLYGNSYFGKYDISKNISANYRRILDLLFRDPLSLTAQDISTLKGMCNRCRRKDQWDWFTTYEYLGRPSLRQLDRFITDSLRLRNELRTDCHQSVSQFRSRYHYMLSSMKLRLNSELTLSQSELDEPIPELESSLWNLLSLESRRNLRMVTKYRGADSIYLLMHYFVTLEQEFDRNLITPFTEEHGQRLADHTCEKHKYEKTHKILLGKDLLTVGAIPFIGSFLKSPKALSASSVIHAFGEFLASTKSPFIEICRKIERSDLRGFSFVKLRNGIAHGNQDVLGEIDHKLCGTLNEFLLGPPHEVLKLILRNSMRKFSS